MAQSRTSGAWIIAGAILLTGLMIVIALVLLRGNEAEPPPTPPPATPTDAPSPVRTKPPKPSPTRNPFSPSSPTPPSPTPPPDTLLVREAVERAANADRPGEVKHIGNVSFYKDSACATREAATVNARYYSPPRLGIWVLCKATSGRWKVASGPIYGE